MEQHPVDIVCTHFQDLVCVHNCAPEIKEARGNTMIESLYSQVIVKVGGESCPSHGHSDPCGHTLTLETKFGDEIDCLVLQDESQQTKK